MAYQNHLVDPTFFYDAIEEFSFNYTIYVVTGQTLNEDGNTVPQYTQQTIRGSLQSQGTRLVQSMTGNKTEQIYKFYCKSLYRIDIGDILVYKNRYMRVDELQDYDEYGVRECSLTVVDLAQYRDLAAYIKYLNGEELV
jgi:hypothetical protein